MRDVIYIGGGMPPIKIEHGILIPLNIMICIDQWYCDIPDTSMEHEDYPLIWMDGINNNVLCIASIARDALECIDLRMKNKRWNYICDPYIPQSISLCDVFECDDKSSDYSSFCKLIK